MSHLFRVAFALCLITIQYVSEADLVTVQASVPIVNECNGIPSLFHKHWHNRNTFGVIIKNGSSVKFQLSKTLRYDYKYKYTEHYLKPTTNLHLCSTTMDEPNKIVITVDNPKVANQRIRINSILEEVRNSTIEINSRDTEFVVWGELNKTAVIQPTYTFCNPKTDYKCAVSPKLLIYDDRNPSQLLPPFRFDILGCNDILRAVLQIDIGQKKFMIKTLVNDSHCDFSNDESIYVTIELYDSLNSSVASYEIRGTDMPLEELIFNIDYNFTFELKAEDNNKVKIFNYTLNDFPSNTFKIYEFGVTTEAAPGESNKLMRTFVDILRNDLEYKPYLKSYQHLTNLLRILQTEITNN